MKHIVCYSGGESSALVAVEVVRRFGAEDTVLVNHDIHFSTEDQSIKKFKREVAEYLGLPVTYANHPETYSKDQFDIVVDAKAFKVNDGSELCTSRLKTQPFMKYLATHHADKDCIIYYGFDPNETVRIQRRSSIMGQLGYRTDYPLALWPERTIKNIQEIGVQPPLTYGVFKHGNCTGCLKAGWQHWYIVYCTRQDIWLKAKWAEDEIGYAIHHDGTGPIYLEDMEERFEKMRLAGVTPTEKIQHQTFWAQARKVVKIYEIANEKPCECSY